MQEFVIGLGLLLVFEGLLYAAFPGGIKSLARQLPEMPDATLRNFGLIAMIAGVVVIWYVKG
jgi:uncharacterized protein